MSMPVAHILGGMAVVEADRRYFGREVHGGWRWAVFCGLMGCLPDVDVAIIFLLGDHARFLNIANGWGPRRGMTHTLLFGFTMAFLCMGFLRLVLKEPFRILCRHGALVFSAIATHLVLDALTAAGDGIPMFWPVSDVRLKSPWPFLPVIAYLTRYLGLKTILTSPGVYFSLGMECVIVGSLYLFFRSRTVRGLWWLVAGTAGAGIVYLMRTHRIVFAGI